MIWHPSPNFGLRRDGAVPDLVVLHYTAMSSAAAALERLCDPAFEVSAHYLIGSDGQVFHLVQEDQRAWHAGAGRWGDVDDVNSRSVGIELDNTGSHPFPETLMEALETLLTGILERWSIPPERVIGHSDMTPGRKIDPGRRFDWRRLAQMGLSIWPDGASEEGPLGTDEQTFEKACHIFGYRSGHLPERLDAFRQRFRPYASGPLCKADIAVLQNLAQRFPVDQTSGSA